MSEGLLFDTILANARVVRPNSDGPIEASIGIKDGSIVAVESFLDPATASEVVDAGGKYALPGGVDAHFHMGIYNPLEEDADSESRAAAVGGVTTALNYMRTGAYYLNRGGSYEEFFPEVLERMSGNSFVDYGFHLAPIQSSHIDEIPMLVDRFGVTSFKIFMFYGGHGLHGRSNDQAAFLMTPPEERYDFAHFEFVMRGITEAMEAFPDKADQISLSLHCETAEIMTAYTKMVEDAGELDGLAAYSAARPQHSEGLAVTIASYLAHETGCSNINLLHLSSFKAMDAAKRMAGTFPHVDFRREVTIGHLLADIETANGVYGKVNPPIRPREDVEALWEALEDGWVDWVVSDHACCKEELKLGVPKEDVFLAKSGFGGSEYLLAGLFSEVTKRGLPITKVAELTSWNPARRYGLTTKGDLAPGFDADIALLDPSRSMVVAAETSPSTQEYTPFEGHELSATVTDVWVRGNRVVDSGSVVGSPTGRYQHRPT
ncbi:MAG: dihydroorotase [Acidimicrobiia bacterium]